MSSAATARGHARRAAGARAPLRDRHLRPQPGPVRARRGLRGCGTSDGDEYLDFLAGISVLNVGHCHPRVVEAVREQAGRLTHATNLYYTEPALRLSQRLSESSLGGKVFLTNSGAEAIEAAIKLVRRARPRREAGRARGAPSTGAPTARCRRRRRSQSRRRSRRWCPGSWSCPRTPTRWPRAVDDQTAAVLLEPIQGETGINVLSDELLAAAREACDRTGAALVFDEIQSGMGRTGTLWAYEQTGVVPDALTSAKALGGGLPIGALVTGERLADVFQPGDHGSTFAGGPLVCAAALVALEICSDPELLERVRELGERLAAGLEQLPYVSAVRGRGLMLAIDLADGVEAPELARRALLEQRLVVNATGPGTIRLEPPLIVSEGEVDEAVKRLGALA